MLCGYCWEPILEEEMVKVGEIPYHWECFFALGHRLTEEKEKEEKDDRTNQ